MKKDTNKLGKVGYKYWNKKLSKLNMITHRLRYMQNSTRDFSNSSPMLFVSSLPIQMIKLDTIQYMEPPQSHLIIKVYYVG